MIPTRSILVDRAQWTLPDVDPDALFHAPVYLDRMLSGQRDFRWSLPEPSTLKSAMNCLSCDSLDSFAAFGGAFDVGGAAPFSADPASTPPLSAGNPLTNAVANLINTISPSVAARVGPSAKPQTNQQDALMRQYLAGNLPDYEIDAVTGQLKPKTNWLPIILIGGGILAITIFAASRRGK